MVVALVVLFSALPSLRGDQAGPYSYVVTKNQAIITNFDRNYTGDLIITNTLGGYPVTAIGNEAFSYCSNLVSVTIPNTVTNVGNWAFADCWSLTNVSIGSNVTAIGTGAFCDCFSLPSVTIPSSVTSIGSWAFFSCTSLTAINVGAGNPSYCSFDGVLFNKQQTVLLVCPAAKAGTYTIHSTVTNISDYAFFGCHALTSVTFPDSVATIGDWAFALCDNLRRAYFTGNAPSPTEHLFEESNNVTVYYLPGTSGWGDNYAGRPALLWNPRCVDLNTAGNIFSFRVTGTTNIPVAVEASTNLVSWSRLCTTNLVGGSIWFSDPASTNYSRCFYRLAGW